MKLEKIAIKSRDDAPHLYKSRLYWERRFRRLNIWPQFFSHSATASDLSESIDASFPALQLLAIDTEREQVFAVAHAVAFYLGDTNLNNAKGGWDWAVRKSLRSLHREQPDSICGLSVTVLPSFRHIGVGSLMVQSLLSIAAERGLRSVVFPVRPIKKDQFVDMSMEDYCALTNGTEGLAYDPWLRTHQRLGGSIEGVCSESMRFEAPIYIWERSAKTRFYRSGSYIIPGALTRVRIDFDRMRGTYTEPNVWIKYTIQNRRIKNE